VQKSKLLVLFDFQILGNNQLDALFHVFIYFMSIYFKRQSAHHQEIELY